ncbi:MAG: GNAT family N-acetyltransferase [Candidatus Eiseniibacteriota bacterium]|jgi:GNAT superfamily N-acetyltransferase
MTPSIILRPLCAGESHHCESILRALPAWFGIEDAIVDYVRSTERFETVVAEIGPKIVGFATIRQHNPHAAEIHVMGVRPEHQGRGIGRALVAWVEDLVRARGTAFLQVKTLGPSRPNTAYARTRGFYEHMGFAPLEENDLWGEVNPCLILVKHLRCADGTRRGADRAERAATTAPEGRWR